MIPFKLRIIREQNRLYQYMLQFLAFFTPHASRVYLFHDIKTNLAEVKSVFSITQSSFEKFLLQKIDQGNKPLNFLELSDVVLAKRKIKNGFYVSFDDANSSVFTKAYPFLKKHNIPFIIFITKELIGTENYLNDKQIDEMSQNPLCTVGSHGLEHNMFRYFSPGEAQRQYKESKKYLEQLTGKPVQCFAFPYGRMVECSAQNIKELEKSNYDFAFSALSGTLAQQWFSGRFFLPRINVDENMIK